MAEVTVDLAEIAPEESSVLDALEQFAQFVDEIYDAPQTRPIQWEGNLNRIAIRSVGRVLCKWRHAVKPNRPPSALIVRLARRLPNVLADVAGHPKRILQRRRAMEPINRLRELDSSCVRWLTRQPGNTLAEKSGHRRAVLAVQRYESVDTLENRVVLDLLKRCSALASSYLRQHQRSYPNHEWIRMTENFLKLCRRLESVPQLHEVSSLPSLPKPNYVLLHEARYKQIWRSYMEVIRQQRRRQQLWAWRHQAYADMATIAWMSSASRGISDRYGRKAAHRFDLRIRETPLQGAFFDWSGLPPIWNVNKDFAFYIGPIQSAGELAKSYGVSDHCFAKFSEDFEDSRQRTVVAKWNGTELNISLLQVRFACDELAESSDGNDCGVNETRLILMDEMTGKRLKQQVVPLALTEQPSGLDTLHRKWCLS